MSRPELPGGNNSGYQRAEMLNTTYLLWRFNDSSSLILVMFILLLKLHSQIKITLLACLPPQIAILVLEENALLRVFCDKLLKLEVPRFFRGVSFGTTIPVCSYWHSCTSKCVSQLVNKFSWMYVLFNYQYILSKIKEYTLVLI